MAPQQRLQRSGATDKQTNDDAQLLDESEQDQVVQQLQRESTAQQRSIESGLVAMCRLVAVVAIAWGVLIQLQHSRLSSVEVKKGQGEMLVYAWVHVALSATVHWLTPLWIGGVADKRDVTKRTSSAVENESKVQYARQPKHVTWLLLFVASLLVGAMGLLQARRQNPSDHRPANLLHYSLPMTNLLTIGMAAMVRLEQNRTDKLLKDLSASKYRYKSL